MGVELWGRCWGFLILLSQVITAGGVSMTQNYSYDLLNRLTQAQEGSAWTQSYLFDAFGNRALSLGSQYAGGGECYAFFCIDALRREHGGNSTRTAADDIERHDETTGDLTNRSSINSDAAQ